MSILVTVSDISLKDFSTPANGIVGEKFKCQLNFQTKGKSYTNANREKVNNNKNKTKTV